MNKKLDVIKTIRIISCKECPYFKYTESNWYCEKMPMGKDQGGKVWREINDVDKIHRLCPLKNFK